MDCFVGQYSMKLLKHYIWYYFTEHEKNSCIVNVKGDNPGTRAAIFEVIKAEKVKEGRSSFVVLVSFLIFYIEKGDVVNIILTVSFFIQI